MKEMQGQSGTIEKYQYGYNRLQSLCNVGYKMASYISATSGNSCHPSTQRTLYKNNVITEQTAKEHLFKPKQANLSFLLGCVDNTKDGKEHFRWDEFQLLLRFWLMTFLVATEHLTKECCKHNCWLFERGQKFKMHGREWIKANQKWSCCQLSIPPERAHGKCSTLLAQCSCCAWKFLTKAHKNQATSTEFLDLGVRQDVKLGGHWQWLLVLKKLCKLC